MRKCSVHNTTHLLNLVACCWRLHESCLFLFVVHNHTYKRSFTLILGLFKFGHVSINCNKYKCFLWVRFVFAVDWLHSFVNVLLSFVCWKSLMSIESNGSVTAFRIHIHNCLTFVTMASVIFQYLTMCVYGQWRVSSAPHSNTPLYQIK